MKTAAATPAERFILMGSLGSHGESEIIQYLLVLGADEHVHGDYRDETDPRGECV